MLEDQATTYSDEGRQDGTDLGDGQATASDLEDGEPEGHVQDSEGEPSGEGLFDGQTGEQLHKSFKELQTEFGKRNEADKELRAKFEKFGGVEQLLESAEFLNNNERFAEFIKSERQRDAYGFESSEMDDDKKSAIGLVETIATRIAEEKVQEILGSQIEPLTNAQREASIEKSFGSMDEKYGSDWRELQDAMIELSDGLDPKAQSNPSFENIEDLYFKALRQSGKFDDYAAKTHQKRLEAMKKKATDKPASKGGSEAPKKANSIQEAFEAAKRAG
jgi:hypothetical protein